MINFCPSAVSRAAIFLEESIYSHSKNISSCTFIFGGVRIALIIVRNIITLEPDTSDHSSQPSPQ